MLIYFNIDKTDQKFMNFILGPLKGAKQTILTFMNYMICQYFKSIGWYGGTIKLHDRKVTVRNKLQEKKKNMYTFCT